MPNSLNLKLTASGSPEDLIAFKGALAKLKQQFPRLDFADRLDLMGVATEFTGAKYIDELSLRELLHKPMQPTDELVRILNEAGITTTPQLIQMTEEELRTRLGPSNDFAALIKSSLERMGFELQPA